MKKFVAALVAGVMVMGVLSGCSGNKTDDTQQNNQQTEQEGEGTEGETTELVTIKVGATPTPHAEILEAIVDDMKAQGYDLQIVEFTDYIQPNSALEAGDLDANYFQHQPYLDSFNEENGTHLVSIAAVHYEPLGLYPGKTTSIDELADGAQIAVPNDPTNEARALLLLESLGLITINTEAGLNATKNDIIDNPKNLDIVEIAAEQLPRSLQDVDMAVINGNYAMQADLNPSTDALAKEEKDSLAADTYANVLVVKEGNEEDPKLLALKDALLSETVRNFINEKYDGAVVPKF